MKIFFVCVFITTLIGCSTSPEKLSKPNAPTMKDIYRQKFKIEEGISQKKHRPIEITASGNEGDSVTSLRKQFPFLPNPVMTVYIFPHLTGGGTPVPGYTTFFKFYERDHVALPEEAIQFSE